jgi:hypothetical protein
MDIVSFGPQRPRRAAPRRPAVIGAAVLVVAALAVVIAVAARDDDRRDGRRQVAAPPAVSRSPDATAPAAAPAPSGPLCDPPDLRTWDALAGLVIDAAAVPAGRTLERCDRAAVEGPWAIAVRRADGFLGRHGAVVTYPVDKSASGRAVKVGRVVGAAGDGVVVWPLGRAYARIRGDLDEADLLAIAARTTVASGRPAVSPPAGYAVVSTSPYRPPLIRETRYGSADVGEQAALGGGLFYTAVAHGAGLEDQFFALGTRDAGLVHGMPAVVSSMLAGNATLAWEPAPGVVAFVGYSGAELDDEAIAALRRLAGRARIVADAQWRATGPQMSYQVNELP